MQKTSNENQPLYQLTFKQQPRLYHETNKGESYEILVQVHIESFINNCIFQNNSGNLDRSSKITKSGAKTRVECKL